MKEGRLDRPITALAGIRTEFKGAR